MLSPRNEDHARRRRTVQIGGDVSIGYMAGRGDENISVAAGALREATTSAQGWAMLGSHVGQRVPVVGRASCCGLIERPGRALRSR